MPDNECLCEPLTGGVHDERGKHTSARGSVALEQAASEAIDEAGRAAPTVGSGKGTVLLVEGDPAVSEIISARLVERGYAVVRVLNGTDGVRQVLKSDFAFIFCDTMMPGLRCDVFFRAVERIRPELSRHFIFTREGDSDAGVAQFLAEVEGLVLKKPFEVDSLNGVIAFAEIRRSYESVVRRDDMANGPEPGGEAFSAELSVDEKVAKILERARAEARSQRVEEEPPVTDPQPPTEGSRGRRTMSALGAAALVAVGFAIWNSAIQDRVEAVSLQRKALELRSSELAQGMKRAEAMQAKMETAQRQEAELAADRAKQRWSPVIRAALAAADHSVQLREFHAGEKSEEEQSWRFTAGGIAVGAVPREVADRFRRNLQDRLAKLFRGKVSVQLIAIEELPGSASGDGDQRRGVFTIEATMGLSPLHALDTKEEK